MKLSDIVFCKRPAPPDGLPVLPDVTEIFSLSRDEVDALPERFAVRGESGFGTATREMLLFLRRCCVPGLFTDMLESRPVGVVAIDDESRIFYANAAYSQIIGVPRQLVLGRFIRDIEPDAAILEVLSGRQVVHDRTVWLNSVKRYVRVNISPLSKDGAPWGAVSFFTDVTETTLLAGELDKARHLADHLRQELESHRSLPKSFDEIIGKNPQLVRVLQTANIVARTDAPLLIQGEHGVGKEVLARAVHAASPRRDKPFIAVNCAAVPDTLLESELFGYEEGAFTGARRGGRMGKFELADKGVLFLDEIGDMPPAMQAKLLRALQYKEIEKIGRGRTVAVDVRVITATNRNLENMVRAGTFRADLYYRLNMVALTLPPLRERKDDIALLAEDILRACNAKYGKNLALSPQLYAALLRHDWPGNVRELANSLEYAVIMCPSGLILPEHLPAQFLPADEPESAVGVATLTGTWPGTWPGTWKETMRAAEKQLLQQSLAMCGNNRSQAIRSLGLSRRAFYEKLKFYGLF